ncbi:unnamed protein product [Symbiodinium sp. CCMP2592]|nr:unnamed protein product [Symbiodinium sp. CCMP2592]
MLEGLAAVTAHGGPLSDFVALSNHEKMLLVPVAQDDPLTLLRDSPYRGIADWVIEQDLRFAEASYSGYLTLDRLLSHVLVTNPKSPPAKNLPDRPSVLDQGENFPDSPSVLDQRAEPSSATDPGTSAPAAKRDSSVKREGLHQSVAPGLPRGVKLEQPGEKLAPVPVPPLPDPGASMRETTPAVRPAGVKREAPDQNVAPVLVYDDDDGDDKPKPGVKLNRKERRAKNALLAEGKRRAARFGISYHNGFGPCHKFVVPENHWQEFLEALATDNPIIDGCVPCQKLLSKVFKLQQDAIAQVEQAAASSEVPHDEEPPDALAVVEPAVRLSATEQAFQDRLQQLKLEEGLVGAKKGRRPKGQPRALHESLFEWLRTRRPDQYVNKKTDKLHLLCRTCGETFAAVRDTTILFVLQHESRQTHVDAAQEGRLRPCRGVEITSGAPLCRASEIKDAFIIWATFDCPWFHTNFKCQASLQDDGRLMIQSSKCFEDERLRMCSPARPYCKSCLGLCSTEEFCLKVSTWCFRIVLCKMAQATFLNNQSLRTEALNMLDSCQKYCPLDAAFLEEQSYTWLYDKLQDMLASIPTVLQNAACKKFIATQFAWLPRKLEADKPTDGNKQKLLSHVDLLLQARKAASSLDQSLCQQILSGALDGNDLARTMITGILNKAQRLRSGYKRVHASELPGADETRVAELGSALSSCTGQESLLRLFGFAAPKKPAVSIWRDDLPMFFAPNREELRRNAEIVLAKWDTQHRDFMVTFDDTCYWPQWSLQMFPEGMVYIGGAGEKSKLSCEQHSPGVLRKEDLSQTCVSYLLKRASTRKQPYDICMIPKRLKDVTCKSVMMQTGIVLRAVTEAANLPPIAIAFDNHSSHGSMNSWFLGLQHVDEYRDLPWFSQCKILQRAKHLPLYRFQTMSLMGHPVFAHNDAPHTQKCLCRGLRVASRTLRVQHLAVHPQIMLNRGLPVAAWRGTDSQSDAQAAWMLNPVCIDSAEWDCHGLVLFQYLTGLLCGSWMASHLYEDPTALFEAALVGYYMVLFELFDSNCSEKCFFHSITVGNVLAIAGHLCERVLRWPPGLPFRPSASMEDSCEHHFSRTKAGVSHSLPTIRAALHSTQRLHRSQSLNMAPANPKKVQQWGGMDEETAYKSATKAFDAVCMLRSVLSINRTAADESAALRNWWQCAGQHIVRDRLKATNDAKLEELAQEEAQSDAEDVLLDAEDLPEMDDPGLHLVQTLSSLEKEQEVQCSFVADAEAVDAVSEKLPLPPAASSVAPASFVEENVEEKPASKVKTLSQMLQSAGYDKYKPSPHDDETAMLSRLTNLVPAMMDFVTQMRLGEAFLRPGQVTQPKKPLSTWNRLQKELSEAQRCYGLQGTRQGRAASWYGFARLVANRAQEAARAVEGCAPGVKIMSVPEFFRPSNVLNDQLQRHYQLLVVKLHAVDMCRIAIVARVWRGSLSKKAKKVRAGCKPHEEALASTETLAMHVILPEPLGPDHPNTFRASSCSQTVSLCPHEEKPDLPVVLCEIVDGWFACKATSTALLIELSDAAAAGWKSLREPEASTVQQADGEGFHEGSFANNDAGHLKIRGYMNLLRSMYGRVTGRSLCTADGKIKSVEGMPPWESVVSRTPIYFQMALKSGAKTKLTNREFSWKVAARFRAVAPVTEANSEFFREFLRTVHKTAAELPQG